VVPNLVVTLETKSGTRQVTGNKLRTFHILSLFNLQTRPKQKNTLAPNYMATLMMKQRH